MWFVYDLSSSKKVKVVSKDEKNSANAVELNNLPKNTRLLPILQMIN